VATSPISAAAAAIVREKSSEIADLICGAAAKEVTFKFANESNHIVKVYVSEDPEALVTKRKASVDGHASISPLDAGFTIIYLNPHKEATVTTASQTIFVRTGFFHASTESWEVTWENRNFPWRPDVAIAFKEDQMNATNTWYDGVQPDAKPVSRADATHPPPTAAPRPRCKYGCNCYRKNPIHFQEESHPGDDSWDIPAGAAAYARPAAPRPAAANVTDFTEGAQVQVYSNTKGTWVDAIVIKSTLRETTVKYESCDAEERVIMASDVKTLLRRRPASAYTAGQVVEVYSQTSGGWVSARVSAAQPDGTITVAYLNADLSYTGHEKDVTAEQQKGIVRSA